MSIVVCIVCTMLLIKDRIVKKMKTFHPLQSATPTSAPSQTNEMQLERWPGIRKQELCSNRYQTGCDEGIADSVDGLLDQAGAPVELVQDGLQWIQPMDFYIHVSRLHFTRCRFQLQKSILKEILLLSWWKSQRFMFSHAYEQNGDWIGCAWIDCADNKLRFPSKLREHLRLHTGEKAVACPSCGNNFATRAKVSKHIQNI